MEMWTEIRRRVLVDGESKRSVQRRFGIHWQTLEKILEHSEPPGYRLKEPRKKRRVEQFLPVIHAILEQDTKVHRKQRHTSRRIYDRLKSEYGYEGGETAVKEAVRAWRGLHQEAFVPLSHPPGHAQVDFGFADAVHDGETIKIALFVMTLPYSDAFFVQAYPRECMEAFHDGHVRAFEFFGGIPRRISYDNSKLAVAKIVGGRGREVTRDFQRLLSHFLFEAHFCRVRRANEKGHVENLVGYSRRNYLVPVPTIVGFTEFNEQLRERCLEDLTRTLRGKSSSKSRLLEDDQQCFLPYPVQEFEVRRIVQTHANSLALVRFDRNDYSVPTSQAHRPITAIGSIDEVRLAAGDQVVARHQRLWGKEDVVFDPIHYLALLERKPGAFDSAKPLENWQLPECLLLLRRRLEAEFEHKGTREFIKVLRLLESWPLAELKSAVDRALELGVIDSMAIRLILEGLRERPAAIFCLDGHPHLSHVRVEAPDLSAYSQISPGAAGG
jgi:transposase